MVLREDLLIDTEDDEENQSVMSFGPPRDNEYNDSSDELIDDVEVVHPPEGERGRRAPEGEKGQRAGISHSSSFSSSRRPNNENPRPVQRSRRMIEVPYDRDLIGTYMMNTLPVSLSDLLYENVEEETLLSRTHITLQILRIITPQGGPTGNAYTRFQRGNNGQQKINFLRILLCHNVGKPCYIMITNEMNNRILNRDIGLRDNGTLTIGSFLRLLAPYPIKRNMQGIPLVQSMPPAVVMETPEYVPAIPIVKNIPSKNTGVAVLKNVIVQVRRTAPIQTTCSGKHCDKARPMDWCFKTNQGCGCYGTSSLGTSNISLVHHVFIHYMNEIIKNEHFSSTKFNQIFMDKPIPPNTMVTALEQTEATQALERSIEECIGEVNENGGFEVLLWYTKGNITDKSLIGINVPEEESQVSSGKINYHIVQIKPMKYEYSDTGCITSELGGRLHQLKFRVADYL